MTANEIKNNDAPALGWVVAFFLETTISPEMLNAKVQTCINAWLAMRQTRREPIFPSMLGMTLPPNNPDAKVYRLAGTADGTVGQTVTMLQELMSLLGNALESKNAEAHVGGNILGFSINPVRPQNVTLN